MHPAKHATLQAGFTDLVSSDDTIRASGEIGGNVPYNEQKEGRLGRGNYSGGCCVTPPRTQNPGQRSRKGPGGEAEWRGANDAVPPISVTRRWGVILAGGDGVRLRHLTRFICGDNRPKQFCPLLGESSLLNETRRRAERTINPDHILYSVAKAHRDYYVRDLADRTFQRIVQPGNRGTAPAVLSALLCISDVAPDAIVAILPCDHYYSSESVFTSTLESAFAIAGGRTGSVVLLGAQPKAPEVEYGWIELGDPLIGSAEGLFHVSCFQEKPQLAVAERLLRRGSLWNTFVMVGHVDAFLDLALAAVPRLLEALRQGRVCFGRGRETRIADRLYDQIAPTDFSRQVLSLSARRLIAMRLGDVTWSDLGDADRVLSILCDSSLELPNWAARWRGLTRVEPASDQGLSIPAA
jgi:mannose-1-phosphate guanylyltransferase